MGGVQGEGSSPARSAAGTETCPEVPAGLKEGGIRGRLCWAHGGSGERGAGERGRKSQPRRRSAEKWQEEQGGPGLPKASAGSWESSLVMCSEEQGAPQLGQFMREGNYLNLALWVEGAGSGPRKNRTPKTCWGRRRAFKSSHHPRIPGAQILAPSPATYPWAISFPLGHSPLICSTEVWAHGSEAERQAGSGLEEGWEGAGGQARAGPGGVCPQPRNQFPSHPQVLFCPRH